MNESVLRPPVVTGIKLVITLDPKTGQVRVDGPINDKILCYGLLEMARECIAEHTKQEQSRILVARPQVVI